MNEEYLRGYFQTYVQPSRKDATYEDWVVKIKDNEEYKRGMFEANVLPSKSDAVYEDWNSKVFGASPVKKKEPSDSKPVGSPIGSAVGEAAKMAARQPEAPVVSPKLGSIVQKAQGSLPQSAGSAVSGLEKGSPSMLKSTSVSEGEAPKTDDYGFGEQLYDSFARGSSHLGKMLAETPAFIYDLAALPQNLIAKYTGLNVGASSSQFAETVGLPENEVANYYENAAKQTQEKINEKYDKDILGYFSTGEYSKGFGLLANQVAESAPVTLSLMMGNYAGATPIQSILGGGTVFGAGRKAELDADPKTAGLPEDVKMSNAIAHGLFEGIFEQTGVTKLGAGIQGLIAGKSKEDAIELGKKSFIEVYGPLLRKYFGVVIEEGLSEGATTFAQNAADKYLGIEPDKNLMDDVINSMIIGIGSGFTYSTPTGILDVAMTSKNRKKGEEITTKRETLIADMSNPNTSETTKQVLSEQVKNLQEESALIYAEEKAKIDALPPESRSMLNDKQQKLAELSESINDPAVSEETRKVLESEFDAIQKEVDEIVESAPEKAASPEVVPPVVEQTTADVGGEISPDVSLTEATEVLAASPETEQKSIINEQSVIANTTLAGLTETENTIGGDNEIRMLDTDPRNSEDFTYVNFEGEKTTDRKHYRTYGAKYRTFKGKNGKQYVQVAMSSSDAVGRDGGASVIFEMTGNMTPQMEQAIFDLKASDYKDGNVIRREGVTKLKNDVISILSGKKAASPETEQIQTQDDSTDITGGSGEVREGQEPIQTKSDETGSREAAETGGVLQSEVKGEELVEVGEAPKKAASPKEIKAELDKRNTDDVFVPVEEGGILGSQNFKKKAQQMFMAFKKVTWDDVYSKRNRKPEYATKQGQRKFEKEFEKWAKENKNQIIAESYVESKANGTNKEFVKAVDNLLASPKETKRTKEIRERRQKAQAIIEKRKLQEEKESQKEAGEFRKTVIAESRKAQPTAYRAVLQYFMQGGKVPVVVFEREVSKQKSEIDRRAGINGILERVDVSETDLKRKGLDAIAERIVGDMGVPESSFSDMLSEVVDELKQMMLSVETDTDARALLYDEIEGALSEEEKRAKEGEDEKIYREKKAKEKEGRVEIDEEFTGAELKEMADEQAELDRVKALENELEERKKKIKELWEKGKSALEKGGITGNSWKELGESNADLLKEVSAYVYAYAKLTGAKLKQAIKNVNDELFGGAFDIDEMAASPELIKAHEKGLADKGKTEVEEILEEETTTGEKRKKSTEQRVLEGGKAEPEVILGLIEQGVDYSVQSQDKSRKVAEKVVAAYRRKFGDNWKVELEFDLDRGAFSRKNLGAIPAYLYDALINASDGLVKARLINKLSDELIDIGRFVAAMNDIHLKNPDALYQVKLAAIGKDIKQSLGFKDDGKAVDPRSKIGKIQDAQERLRRAKKESISEAAEKVTSKGQAKKGALSPEKRKERGKKKVDEALEGLKQWLTNPKMSAKMDLNDLYENQKEFNGLIFKLADGFFDQGVANAAQLITKMKEALANLGIDEDSFDSIKDRFLSDFDLENKLMDQRREEGAEKLAKKIVNLVKQPKKKEFDPVKQMVETLFGKVKETVTVPAKPKSTAEEKIQEALANFYEYESVFNKSRLEVIDMIDALDISDTEKRAMKDKLEKYMTEELNVPFGEKLSSEYVKQKMKEKAVDIKKVLLTANEIQAATREQFVSELVDKLRLDANLTASEAKKIADEFYKEYDKLIEAKKGQILKQTIGADVKAKFARKPEHQRIMEAIKHGALDGKMIKVKNEKGETGEYDSTYLFAEKYGIPDIYNPEIQETLKAFTESIAKLPPNSVQRKIVEREFNAYLDYLKGESKNRWQTLVSMGYSNILFDYGTWTSIIVSNINRTFFDSFIKVGRKLLFEPNKLRELGPLGSAMVRGFKKSVLSAKGILLYDTMREGSKIGKSEILRIKAKYAKNKFLKRYFKFLAYSNRVLESLDALVTVAMAEVETVDFVFDRLNAENKKLLKKDRLTNEKLREYAYEIMGLTPTIIEEAEAQATEEFKEQYGDDFEMTGKTAVLWKQRVEEIKRELGMERIKGPKIPEWVSFTSTDFQRLYEQAAEKGGKIGMVGAPPGTLGVASALLEKFFKNIIFGELAVKFLNAGMNSASFVLKSSPLGIIPVVKYYVKSQRGFMLTSNTEKVYDELGVRREMYGYGGRIEKREELLTWLAFQTMTSVFMAAMFGEEAIAILSSMFRGDDDEPEKTQNLGIEGRYLYFGKNMDGKSGKWKDGLFVTGRMFGDFGENWQKTREFTQATGIEPNTVYYNGKKVLSYKNNPVYTAMFGYTAVASDLLLFNDKMDEITQGFLFKTSVSQLMMTLESSPMKGVSELFNLLSMRRDVINMSDDVYERTIDNTVKTIAMQTRNTFIPRFLMTMEQDIEGAMGQQDRIDLSWYELATRDWPIVNNLFDREIKYDHFGRPLLRKTKAKSFLLGVPAVDVADGTVYSPVLFDVSNEGEVSSPFANSVRGGESAREYALFASKGSRAYLLPDGKVVKITGNKGEVKTVKMDKRQYNEFANKVSLRFGDYVRDNFEELSKYPSQREYDKLVEDGKETPYPPFDEVVKDEKNIIIESVLQDMFLGGKEKSYPIRLVTKEE